MKSKEEADQYLKNYIQEKTGTILNPSEISDFGLTGEESEVLIEEYADDYISECETDEAEYRARRQDRQDEINEHQIIQSEMYESFRSEY